jgi:hypothetical protein
LEKAVQLSPSFGVATAFLAASCARSGDQDYAEKLIEQLRQRSSEHYVSPFCFAVYEAARGQTERVFEFLEAALAERDPYLTRMDSEPYFEGFRSHRRYRDLLGKVNLA